mgnify:FL=1
MKKITFTILLFSLFSCGKNGDSISDLNAKKMEIISNIETLEKELAKIDSNLVVLDTNKIVVEDLPLVSTFTT